MSIIIFQIIVFLIILYAGNQSISRLIVVTGILCVFTIAMVKTSPLMILQFVTIILSFLYCLKKGFSVDESPQTRKVRISQYRKKSSPEIFFRILLNFTIISITLYGFYKWIKFSFADDDGFLIFLGILNLLMFGFITYIIVFFLYKRIKDLWTEMEAG